MTDPAEQPIARGTPAYRRLSIALLMAGFATFALLYGVQPLLPLFTTEYGVSAAEASLAVSLATGPMAVALLFAGVLSDRIGRRPIMAASLFVAAGLTIVSAVLPGWGMLLVMRLLTGVALAGVPAVAMAYVAEEVDAASIGAAMGLYIAGSALGGMAGRLGVSILADYMGWREALAGIGVAGLVAALAFRRLAPPSRAFAARRHDLRSFAGGVRALFGDAALPWLYAEAFLLMGAFVTVYNYTGFRLTAAPYDLSQTAVGAIFLLYIVGSFSSAWFGGLAGRIGRRKLFWMPIVLLLGGIAVTTAAPLPLIILGIGVFTGGFFGAHSIASSWVGRRARQNRGQAAALYLFFYYLGSSILGSAGGFAWSHGGWHGVALFVGTLGGVALVIALHLSRVPPLPENPPVPDVEPSVPAG
ncbi:MFS transporter [Glacieibacterium sp.]|uniref:MFS transporter n=1 Tax=Glacieibacterium sp. TaxID=2860237 RepID=UPI003AFF613B